MYWLKRMVLFKCQECGYSDYAEDITDSYQCPRCLGLMIRA